jgi:hypothetical protein
VKYDQTQPRINDPVIDDGFLDPWDHLQKAFGLLLGAEAQHALRSTPARLC